jgi:hypothetical protein
MLAGATVGGPCPCLLHVLRGRCWHIPALRSGERARNSLRFADSCRDAPGADAACSHLESAGATPCSFKSCSWHEGGPTANRTGHAGLPRDSSMPRPGLEAKGSVAAVRESAAGWPPRLTTTRVNQFDNLTLAVDCPRRYPQERVGEGPAARPKQTPPAGRRWRRWVQRVSRLGWAPSLSSRLRLQLVAVPLIEQVPGELVTDFIRDR